MSPSHMHSPSPSQPGLGSADGIRTTGTVLGAFPSYEPAQEMVDRLADAQFPVESISIVGKDLVNVERVVQRLSYPRVAMSAALSGVTLGSIVGIGFGLFSPDHNWSSVFPMAVIGGCLWVIMNVIGYALQGGKRDFVTQSQIVATRYEVVCEPEAAAAAKAALQLPAGERPTGSEDASL